PDLIILDVELPDACGFDVCKTIKKNPATSQIPVIFLSGRRISPEDVSCGYDDGAINYLIKPFNPNVLLAISRSLIRWVARRGKMPRVFKKDGITLREKDRQARLDGKTLKLTAKEFELLFLLLKNSGKVVEKETLLNAVWGCEELDVCEHSLNEYMSRLRTKLGEPLAGKIITIYGIGYKFEK
ncbi:MAG: response regulator transcription factor, partial [Endomicrobiia bacterium]|nr:response regulator transcription factor [Endomicrobiia bacterium]